VVLRGSAVRERHRRQAGEAKHARGLGGFGDHKPLPHLWDGSGAACEPAIQSRMGERRCWITCPGDAVMTTDRLLKVRTVLAEDRGDLLGQLHGPGPLAWVRGGNGLIGWGAVATLTVPAGPGRFAAAERMLRGLFDAAETEDQVGLPGCGPVAFGSFTFDPAREGSVLVVPRTVAGRRDGTAWVTTITAPGQGIAPEEPPAAPPTAKPGCGENSLTAPQWEHTVATVIARIRGGGLRKVVLARDLHVTTGAPIDMIAALKVLADRDPGCYVYACAELIGATPELLIQREGTHVRSRVIAGTAPRGSAPAGDVVISAALLASAKQSEEHQYAAESVSQVLAPLCEDLIVDTRPSVIRLADTHHLATALSGTLTVGASALKLAGVLHPTAAVCGTPRSAAMSVISELESMDRGRYAGPVGWMDARGDGEWGLALHCGEINGSRARLFAGCGIVAGSDPAAELAESEAKFRPMLRALGLSPGQHASWPAEAGP
jgi:menaquinone-specific isochorismate synthase